MEKPPSIFTEDRLLEIERSIEKLLNTLEEALKDSLKLLETIEHDIQNIETVIMISAENEEKTELESIRNQMLETKKKLEEGINVEKKDLEERREALLNMNRENQERRTLLLQNFDGAPQ